MLPKRYPEQGIIRTRDLRGGLQARLGRASGSWTSCFSTRNNSFLIHPPTMSWRNQGITGSNNIPLGTRRRFGGENADDGGYNPAAPAEGLSELKRGRSPTRGKSLLHELQTSAC